MQFPCLLQRNQKQTQWNTYWVLSLLQTPKRALSIFMCPIQQITSQHEEELAVSVGKTWGNDGSELVGSKKYENGDLKLIIIPLFMYFNVKFYGIKVLCSMIIFTQRLNLELILCLNRMKSYLISYLLFALLLTSIYSQKYFYQRVIECQNN